MYNEIGLIFHQEWSFWNVCDILSQHKALTWCTNIYLLMFGIIVYVFIEIDKNK